MSNLLEQASLVLIPSGYKEDVVYSEIPINGAGDMSFTRASNGTRINSQGLVEVVAWNLLEQSETFENAVWLTYGTGTITANTTTAPNGTTTADKFTPNTTNTQHACEQNMGTTSGSITMSIYAKADGYNWLCFNSYVGGFKYTWFNISNGTIGTIASGVSASIENVGNGWYRCIVSLTGGANTYFSLVPANANNVTSFAGDGTSGIFIWGAQLNIGATAKPYFPTTDRLNVPRLTYQNGGGGCPSLLLEKQSTNLVIYSEQFDNASWTKQNGSTITANSVISPDGTQNADTLNVTTTAYSSVYNTTPYSASTGVYTQSIYAKKGTKNWLYILDLGGSGAKAWFNLDAGVVGTVASGYTATMENVGNGWYRCILTETANRLPLYFQFGASDADNSFQPSSAGTAYIWGAQLEASSYPTSYIPTTSSSATRVADACFKTGISSLIGQTEGVIFADINPEEFQTGSYIGITDGTITNRIIFGFESGSVNSGTLQVYGVSGVNGSGTYTRGQRMKIALAYKSGNSALYVNGSLISTATTTFTASFSQFRFDSYGGTQNFIGKLNEAILFPTRLTNAELAQLTA